MAEPTNSQQTIAAVRAVRKTDSFSFSSVNVFPRINAKKTAPVTTAAATNGHRAGADRNSERR